MVFDFIRIFGFDQFPVFVSAFDDGRSTPNSAINYRRKGSGGLKHGDAEILAESHVGIGGVAAPTIVGRLNEAIGFMDFDTSELTEAEFIIIIVEKFFATLLSDLVGVVAEKF